MSIELSLICPIYKVRAYIPNLLDSFVLGINVSEVEVIFVNDCCPEGSMDVCKEYIDNNKELIKFKYRFIDRKTNGGVSVARNDALLLSTGDYVGFVDSDDIISCYYWEFLSDKVRSGTSDIIEFSYQEFKNFVPEESKPVNKTVRSSQLNPYKTGFFLWSRLFRREFIQGLTFPEGVIFEDVCFSIQAFSKAKSTERYAAKLVFYRKRKGSITSIRTSNYSQLITNLVYCTIQSIPNFEQPGLVRNELIKKVSIAMLKGLLIADRGEKRRFYKAIVPVLDDVKKIYNKNQSSVCDRGLTLFCRMICYIGLRS